MANEALTSISTEYFDFADVFSLELALKLPKHIGIYNYAIKLVDDQQSPYGSIYSLGPIELKILKIYIETHLKNSFIRPSDLKQELPSFLIRSQIAAFKFALIIGDFTISPSITNIHYFLSKNP